MSTACTASLSGLRAPAVPCGRGSARVARASAVTAKATGGVAKVEKQQEQHPTFANLRRSAAAAAAAAVIVAGAPDAALATEYERGVPPAPSNGPLKNLPRELTEPDEIFREDFTVKFAGLEVDHKYLVGALIVGQGIGFLGSAIGGNEARKKGDQVKALNESLIKVNAELRREMREAGLGPYVPIPAQRFIEKADGTSTDEDDKVVSSIIFQLKNAKRLLKEQNHPTALAEFKAVLKEIESNPESLAQAWKAARKAHRGIGAACERMGKYEEALAAMETVLSLSVEHNDHSGETDALGVIADIYTDMDKLEEAAEYYDMYFNSLQEEDARTQASSDAAMAPASR